MYVLMNNQGQYWDGDGWDSDIGEAEGVSPMNEVRVPLYIYVLAGRSVPTPAQARLFATREMYGGSLDGITVQMPNVVDWSRSDVDLSPLVPWLGNPDATWPRRLRKKLEAKWPELKGRLDVIRLDVEIIGDGYKWGDLYPIRAL